MKQKEFKNLAKKIAQLEYIIQTSQDDEEIDKAQVQTMLLISKIQDFEDMDILDEMIQKELNKISNKK